MTGEVNEKYLRAQSASDGEGGKLSEPTKLTGRRGGMPM